MASIHREIDIEASPERVWSAVRAVDDVHRRLVPGVLVDAYREGAHRVVTFTSGAVVCELIVGVDDDRRRLVYGVVDSPFRAVHHQASMQVLDRSDGDGGEGGSRVVWITDVVPDDLAWPIADLMDQGAEAMQRVLGAEAPSVPAN
jgi:hypothetical protein